MLDFADYEHAYDLIKKFHDERQTDDVKRMLLGDVPDMVDALITRAQMDVLAWMINDTEFYGEEQNQEFAEGAARFEKIIKNLETHFAKK